MTTNEIEARAKHQIDKNIVGSLRYNPCKSVITKAISTRHDLPDHHSFSIGDKFKIDLDNQSMFANDKVKITKFAITLELRFQDSDGKMINIPSYNLDLSAYAFTPIADWLHEDVEVLTIDEVLHYINWHQNEQAKTQWGIPPLRSEAYITNGRRLRNQFFKEYNGEILNLHFQDELDELYATISNSIAFLHRNKLRVFAEAEMIGTIHYQSFNLHPRFNNTISEAASGIYNFWERITFTCNEIFPINDNYQSPSYSYYFKTKYKEESKSSTSVNSHLAWFHNRLDNEHTKLTDLRHPSVHYNLSQDKRGVRSARLIKEVHEGLKASMMIPIWTEELRFLTSELENLSLGLEHLTQLWEFWFQRSNC